MFYLYMRSLTEKELGQPITRLTTGDVRQLRLSRKKCLKLIRHYYQNIGAISEDNQEIDQLSAELLDHLIADATVNEKYE